MGKQDVDSSWILSMKKNRMSKSSLNILEIVKELVFVRHLEYRREFQSVSKKCITFEAIWRWSTFDGGCVIKWA